MTKQTVPSLRPTTTAPCSCIWKVLAERRAEENPEEPATRVASTTIPPTLLEQTRSAIPNPLNAIPSFLRSNNHEQEEEIIDTETVASANPLVPNASAQLTADAEVVPVESAKSIRDRRNQKTAYLNKGSLAGKQHPDVYIRAFKKRFSQSSENKLGKLISYREDLVSTLGELVPLQNKHDRTSSHPPVITPVPRTPLCRPCLDALTYALYFSPARSTPYLREHSTSGYLSIIDDAVASLQAGVPMEYITHKDVDTVFRAELAVTEWRITLKLARFHKRTGYLDAFPVRIGEYAELKVANQSPKSDGIVKKAGKKVMAAVGLGNAAGPASGKQGALAAAAADV
ncbi:hypothetical protein HKX48_008448 [Thoreauomyces humboldtii]|nr:hypothetical protein HKX48_008448 [Thoreauomyces humboldtii]